MDKSLLYPLLGQVLLTFVIGLLAFKARVAAVKQQQVSPSYFKHNRGKAPEEMMRWTDNYQNQFELPVLFYTLIALLLITQITDTLFIIGAWAFVVTRIVHAYIHVTNNHILYRMRSFVFGFFILLAMWLGFIFQIINA